MQTNIKFFIRKKAKDLSMQNVSIYYLEKWGSNMKNIKNTIICFLCCLFIFSGLIHNEAAAATAATGPAPVLHTVDINNDGLPEYQIEAKGWVESVRPVVKTTKYEHATYTYYQYKKDGRNFDLTFVKLKNGSLLYFVRHANSGKAEPVQLRVTALDPAIEQTASLVAGNEKSWKKFMDASDSYASSIYVDGSKLFYRIGKAEAYKPLGNTVYKEIPQANTATTHTQNDSGHAFLLTMNAGAGTESVTWGMLSDQPLIRWENQQAETKAAQLEFEIDKKLREDGVYYANESTYRPYEPGSFYRNPANIDGLRSLAFLSEAENGVWFKNIASHLAYTAVQTQTNSGYWETYPRSEWLHQSYGIGYRYMDNRRNIDNATFLLHYYWVMPDPVIKKALDKWDAYLMDYAARYGMKVGTDGLFVPDYVGAEGSKPSHTSLNHLVATMNYLYEVYLYNGDESKKLLGNRLLAGIQATRAQWIMPDQNLYYAMYPDLTPHPYSDYAYLTRDDLVFSQYLLLRVNGHEDPDLQALINSKNAWLETPR
ncbi:hypothetical protein HMPREF0083_02534 [Aneurinibacillus aneurinilyticus ATCC 12856]|uniref:D-glucuronyl C5-epimerase n=2 Tax=Aneurinibacillus aneurinilyticus TaxID=1391 RepID=U1WLB3_ANEAE|nr:hypothetical protein HMPREF0083_02534 [Aneurinibacillus aneurinilyticus ATCC 12856]